MAFCIYEIMVALYNIDIQYAYPICLYMYTTNRFSLCVIKLLLYLNTLYTGGRMTYLWPRMVLMQN